MDIDQSEEESKDRFDDPPKMDGAVVEYSKKNFGVMGRCLKQIILIYFKSLFYETFSWSLTKRFLSILFYFAVRFRDDIISFLDGIDNRVEALRKEAHKLQEERDRLLTRIDMLKNTDLLSNLSEADHEEVSLTLKRINERLQVRLHITQLNSTDNQNSFCSHRPSTSTF